MKFSENTFIFTGNYGLANRSDSPGTTMLIDAIHDVIAHRLRVKAEWLLNPANAGLPEFDPSIKPEKAVSITVFLSEPKLFKNEGGEDGLDELYKKTYEFKTSGNMDGKLSKIKFRVSDVNVRNYSDFERSDFITTTDASGDSSVEKSKCVVLVHLESLCTKAARRSTYQ